MNLHVKLFTFYPCEMCPLNLQAREKTNVWLVEYELCDITFFAVYIIKCPTRDISSCTRFTYPVTFVFVEVTSVVLFRGSTLSVSPKQKLGFCLKNSRRSLFGCHLSLRSLMNGTSHN
jgi:hypothetical protein